MSKYRSGGRRSRTESKGNTMEGKLFMQLLICVALVCGFMFFKDTPLPNGKTPSQYVKHFLVTTVKIDDLVGKIKGTDTVPASGNANFSPTPSPTQTPAPTPTPTPTS